jgi:hypothetical protein
MYLFLNTTSHKTKRFANHFLPSSEIFRESERARARTHAHRIVRLTLGRQSPRNVI